MLYNLLYPLADDLKILNLFKYLTFRAGGAVITALFITMIIAPAMIRWLKKKQGEGQPIRADGPKTHLKKQGTPTMGGLMIIFSTTVSTLLWADIQNKYMWIVLGVFLAFGFIGFFDDYSKLTKKSHIGISGKGRLLFEAFITGSAILLFMKATGEPLDSTLAVPFFKNLLIDLGWFFIPFGLLVVIGTANAVNLTDGLDGLAISLIMIAVTCFAIISYLIGNAVFAEYLKVPHVPNVGELAILCAAIIGSGMGFLWYNCHPAEVFMGDTGSLALGGALGMISVVTKHELVLAIVGGIFVAEVLSDIIQVSYFKYTGGKRIFLMAPLHHHFEQKGWAETKVVARFGIIATVLALIGLASLKIR